MRWYSSRGDGTQLSVERFASLENHHLLVMQYRFTALQDGHYKLRTGIDGRVWSINGEHFKSYRNSQEEDLLSMELNTVELDTTVVVTEGVKIQGPSPQNSVVVEEDRRIIREFEFQLEKNQEIVLEKVVSITHDNELKDPMDTGRIEVFEGLKSGYDQLRTVHQAT